MVRLQPGSAQLKLCIIDANSELGLRAFSGEKHLLPPDRMEAQHRQMRWIVIIPAVLQLLPQTPGSLLSFIKRGPALARIHLQLFSQTLMHLSGVTRDGLPSEQSSA